MLMSMLTTTDNPYDPFTQFDEWYNFDETHGYHSSGLLARMSADTEELGESSSAYAREQAIDEIVEMNLLGNHIKVTKEVETVTASVKD